MRKKRFLSSAMSLLLCFQNLTIPAFAEEAEEKTEEEIIEVSEENNTVEEAENENPVSEESDESMVTDSVFDDETEIENEVSETDENEEGKKSISSETFTEGANTEVTDDIQIPAEDSEDVLISDKEEMVSENELIIEDESNDSEAEDAHEQKTIIRSKQMLKQRYLKMKKKSNRFRLKAQMFY